MKTIISRAVIVSLLSILFFALFAAAAGPNEGIISGKVVNRTGGISRISKYAVKLTIFQNGAELDLVSAETNANGAFEFAGLMLDKGYTYVISVEYGEATYKSGELRFENQETYKDITINVYEPTKGDEGITIAEAYTVVLVGEKSIQIADYYIFNNDSDRTFIGAGEVTSTGRRKTLSLALPSGGSIFRVGNELDAKLLHLEDGELYDTAPVMPGEKRLTYVYTVPLTSKSYSFNRKVAYPMESYRILVETDKATASSDSLTGGGVVLGVADTAFTEFSGVDFARGEMISAVITVTTGKITIQIIMLAAAALIVAASIVTYVYISRRKVSSAASSSSREMAEDIVQKIAKLDDDFDSGKVDSSEYAKLRTEMKAQAVMLRHNIAKGGGR